MNSLFYLLLFLKH